MEKTDKMAVLLRYLRFVLFVAVIYIAIYLVLTLLAGLIVSLAGLGALVRLLVQILLFPLAAWLSGEAAVHILQVNRRKP